MPVLMNKGDDPRRAAWLFYTDRAELDEWGRQIVEGRWDSARLVARFARRRPLRPTW